VLAKNIILANGAYDTPVAFPGWTLPGVMTCGAALTLLKTYRLAPGTKALVTGTGPLLLSVAAHLIEAGVRVTAICEANRLLPKSLTHLPTMLGHLHRVWEGIQYASRTFPAGTPYKTGWSIVSASGRERVEQAVITKLDRNGRPIHGKTQTLDVDLVVSGYNLTPNTGLARMVDCKLEYRPEKGGWIPVRDEDMRTSKPGIYVVGDGAGIGGADNALLEGQIAGVSVALETGHLPSESAEKIRGTVHRKRQNQLRFGRLYSDLFTPPPGLVALADDETVLCRCEEVTLGQVKEAVQLGATRLKEVKMATRCGMGNCQGRMCEHSVSAAMVEALSGELADNERVGHYSIRPPLHPLPAQFLAEAQVETRE
jgi:D-hydroxyproline dehydrogenase subunit alpha